MELNSSTVILFLFLRFCNVLSNNKTEGSACVTEEGSVGICMRLTQCKPALENLKSFVFPKICSFNLWEPTVCCLDCRDVHKNSKMTSNFIINGYGKANEKCLEEVYDHFPCNIYDDDFKDLDDSVTCYANSYQISPVVAGGYNAQRNEYPHMALIGYGDDPDNADWMCGGSVISEKYIITAAHCISSPSLGEIKYAALGILKRTDSPKLWQRYDVIKIIAYPEYRPPSKYHDIALLATGAKIRFNHAVLPACLHRERDMAQVAKATGWGAMGHRKPLAEILQVVDIYKFSDKECMEAYPKHRLLINGYDATTQACYGDREQIYDTCEGDSGGPLQIKTEQNKKSKCIYTIIGITSYGRACGYVGSSGMYTKVAHYVPWIESITGKLR